MSLANILIGAAGVLFFLIALAIAVHHEIEGRRRDAATARAWVRRELHDVSKEIASIPLYERRTIWIDGEPHSVTRPLHHTPRHNRGALYEDLSLTRFEKDADDGR